jgi:mono/diheme cytochrome c family protein
MTLRMLTVGSLLVSGTLFHAGATLRAQGPRETPRPRLATSLAGADSYDRYCAPCHGANGIGDGPVAPALKTRPADLTTLAQRNRGRYPREQVFDFVVGEARTLPAHGSTEMPIWGGLFRAFEADGAARQRIQNVVSHIEKLQPTAGTAGDVGGRLYREHCAACHGTNARGDGPIADRLRHAAPDLTQYAARSGGAFPEERLRQIIDGRHAPTHGDRDMPIWGDVFRVQPDSASKASVTERIEALVRYLAGIQERRG